MPRPRVYRTEAIVLRGSNYGEADRILTLLTLKQGKLRAIAKGVRRAASHQGGHLELFNHVETLLAVGRELDVITQSEVRHPFRSLREQLDRTSHAYYLAELVDRLVEERAPAPEVFALALAGLQALDRGDEPRLVLCQFQLRLLAASGFGPELFQCVGCRAELRPEVNFFSPASGGMLCPACAPAEPLAYRLSLGAFKLLRHLRRTDLSEGARVRVGEAVSREGSHAARDYVECVLERKLRAPEFIARVEGG
ncbi:MAG: DNA repair protein RecO [Chloroflexi bacterium]|nr:DNA repair protein RecO [Chloroflexota bacterium]